MVDGIKAIFVPKLKAGFLKAIRSGAAERRMIQGKGLERNHTGRVLLAGRRRFRLPFGVVEID